MGQGQVVKPRDGIAACPCCGGPLDPALAKIGSVLSRRQQQLFLLLRRADRPLTVGELAERLFAEEDRGGPDWADGVVTTAVARMRRKIAQHHLPIRIWTSPEGGYRLEAA